MNILAFNDLLFLIAVLFAQYSSIFNFKVLPLFYNTLTCKVLSFSIGYLPAVSSWILSFMSIERLFIIKLLQLISLKESDLN